jgi:hypothetical protein
MFQLGALFARVLVCSCARVRRLYRTVRVVVLDNWMGVAVEDHPGKATRGK